MNLQIGAMILPVYQIVQEGNSVLREKAKPIVRINDAAIRLLNNLRDTLLDCGRGVGLAAPQIGISKRAFIIAIPDEDIYYEMVNPELIDMEGEEEAWEGCLSVPGIEGFVQRAVKLRVRYMDREGQTQEMEAEGYMARIIQHENDHLDGLLFKQRTTTYQAVSPDTGEEAEADTEDSEGSEGSEDGT